MSNATPATDIQFDQAEYKGDPVPIACATCGNAIQSTYYQVAGSIACDRCRRRLEWDATNGSALGRFVKAAGLGLLAAALGAALYYAVRALTGYEFGLIAVVVGVVVGGAVRMGSGHRGGVPYQLLAMVLTYASIVSTYVPDIWKGLSERDDTAKAAPANAGNAAPAAGVEPSPVTGAAAAAPATPPETRSSAALSLPLLALALLGFAAIVFISPFLMGFENIIGIVIIAIGLYEAWKINRKPDRTVTGPFRIEDASAVAPVPVP